MNSGRSTGAISRKSNYILAMALIPQLRLGNTADVLRLVDPYLSGSRDSFATPSQSSLAAHMLFYEIARRTGDERAAKLVIRAANSGFAENGSPRDFMPLHGGWSDSLFMDIPILAKAGALSGDRKYFDMAARHFFFMQKIVRPARWSLPAPGIVRCRVGTWQRVSRSGHGADVDGFSERPSGLSRTACGRFRTT